MSTGHSAGVTACAVSPDGSFFVSASRDNTLKVWDPTTGGEIRTLSGHSDEVLFCAVGRDSLVYSAGPSSAVDAVVKVWDPATGAQVANWELREISAIKGFALSPAGDFLACLTDLGYVDVFHLTGEKVRHIDVGSGAPYDACEAGPDGRFIVVTGGREHRVIDPLTSEVMHAFQGPDYGVQVFGLTPDAASIAFFEKDTGWAMGDIASGVSRMLADEGLFSTCAISPDGSLLAAGHSDATETWTSVTGGQRTVEAASVRLQRTDSTQVLHEFDLRGDEATVNAFSPDGSLVLAAGGEALHIWDVETGEEIGTVPLEAEATCLVVHPTRPIAALGDTVGGFHVLDLGGIEFGRIIVTAGDHGSGPAVECPACLTSVPIEAAQLGGDADCPSCGLDWRVNPFLLSFRTEPLDPAGLQEADEEEATRLRQARNRAIFTAGSIEDLAALAQEESSYASPAPSPAAGEELSQTQFMELYMQNPEAARSYLEERVNSLPPPTTPDEEAMHAMLRRMLTDRPRESGGDLFSDIRTWAGYEEEKPKRGWLRRRRGR